MSEAGAFEPSRRSRPQQILGAATGVLLVIAVGYAVSRHRTEFTDSWHRIGLRGFCVGLLFGLANALFTWRQWRTIMKGLGIDLEPRVSARVFFISQLGKYVPGAVWPLMLQTESARRHGADRRAVVAGNIITIVVSLMTGLVIAAVLLPFSVPSALGRFWWALAAVPLLLIAIRPSTLPTVLDAALGRLGRQPLGARLSGRSTRQAVLWSLAAWGSIGAQTTVLARAVGADMSGGLFPLCVGGTALAIAAGILFLPAPAGAGPRELVLVYVLTTVLTASAALAVVVASRVISIVVDILVAGVGLVVQTGERRHRPTRPTARRPRP
jgi:hypothetical protein